MAFRLVHVCEVQFDMFSTIAAHLLISQSGSQSSAHGDSELLNALNTIRQCIEEVTDIMATLKPQLQVCRDVGDEKIPVTMFHLFFMGCTLYY